MSDTVILDGELSLTNQLDGQGGAYNRYDWRGYSAYEIAVQHGYTGTEEEWLASLQGEDGATGPQGQAGPTGPQGPKGDPGDDYTLTEQDKQDIAGMVDTPVDDVQINGTSIVADGVANIPVASASNLGTIKTASNAQESGIELTSSNYLRIYPPSVDQIKRGGASYMPIVPRRQHAATFYGLATAAGDTTQSQSGNPVGTYTEDAKTAIRTMLGIETLSEIISAIHDSYAEAEGVSF